MNHNRAFDENGIRAHGLSQSVVSSVFIKPKFFEHFLRVGVVYTSLIGRETKFEVLMVLIIGPTLLSLWIIGTLWLSPCALELKRILFPRK